MLEKYKNMHEKFRFELSPSVIVLYLVLKLFIVFFTYYINSYLLGNENFTFADLHDYTDCDPFSYNILYALTLCHFDVKTISSIYTIFIAYFISCLRDIGYIYLASKLVGKNYLIIFVLIISCHPYLAIYHPRFVTSLFASIGFLTIFWVVQNKININLPLIVLFMILTGFRNALMPVFIVFIILDCYKNLKNLNYKKIILYLTSIIFIFLITKVPDNDKGDYALALMSSNDYFSWHNINRLLLLDNTLFSYVISFPMVFISHFVLLLGFREEIFTSGIETLLVFDNKAIFQLVIFVGLFIFHLLGLVGFYRNFKNKDVRFLCFLAYFIPSMLFVAHLRYFYPMIPLATLGFILLLKEFNSFIRKNKQK